MSYASEVLADSPVWYGKLTEGGPNGASAPDSSTTADNGTYHNTTQATPGPFGGDTATTFVAASTAYINITDNAAFSVGDVFTIEAWVAGTSFANSGVFSGGDGSFEMNFGSGGEWGLARQNVSQIVLGTSNIPADGTWHHLVATKNGATVKLYLDGVDKTGTVTNDTCVNATSDLYVGAGGNGVDNPAGGTLFNGKIGQVALYATALSAARVTAHYNAAFTAVTYAVSMPAIRLPNRLVGPMAMRARYRRPPILFPTPTDTATPTVTPPPPLKFPNPKVGPMAIRNRRFRVQPPTPAGAQNYALALAGAIAGVGTLINAVAKAAAGSITPVGALLKTAGKAAAGTLAPAGALTKNVGKAAAGVLGPAGTIGGVIAKGLAGAITPAGVAAKAVATKMAGSITPSGALTALKTALLSVAGTITPAGTLAKAVAKNAAGALTPAGALAKACGKTLAGSLTPAGALVKAVAKNVAGTCGSAGSYALSFAKGLAGTITPAGALTAVKAIGLTIAGALTPSGAVAKAVAKNASGDLTPTGAIRSLIGKLLGGVIDFLGDLVNVFTGTRKPGTVTLSIFSPTTALSDSAPRLALSMHASSVLTLVDFKP